MFSWHRKKLTDHLNPRVRSLRERGIRNHVFFRLDTGLLRDAELPTENEDVPKGAPILQHLCYELPFPWFAHAITISVWHATIIAQIARNKDSIFRLYFTEWDDGWLLAVTPPEQAGDVEIIEIISTLDALITRIGHVRDVRWFHDEVLTCGVFHGNDFDHGTVTPFDNEQISK